MRDVSDVSEQMDGGGWEVLCTFHISIFRRTHVRITESFFSWLELGWDAEPLG